MTGFQRSLFLSCFATCVLQSAGLAGGRAGPGITPTIVFSKDEREVTIRYRGGPMDLSRGRSSARGTTGRRAGPFGWPPRATTPKTAVRNGPSRPWARPSRWPAPATWFTSAKERTASTCQSGSPAVKENAPIVLSWPPALGKVKITPPREYVQANPHGAVIAVEGAKTRLDQRPGDRGPRAGPRPRRPKITAGQRHHLVQPARAGLPGHQQRGLRKRPLRAERQGHGGTRHPSWKPTSSSPTAPNPPITASIAGQRADHSPATSFSTMLGLRHPFLQPSCAGHTHRAEHLRRRKKVCGSSWPAMRFMV